MGCRPKQRQGLLQWAWDSSEKFDEKTIEKNARRMAKLSGSKLSLEMFAVSKGIVLDW